MTNNRKLLLLDSDLAMLIGYKEALILGQLHYWIENNKRKNKNFSDGKYWAFSSIDNWQVNNFPFWSKNTIIRIIKTLIEKEYIFTNKVYQSKNNQTKSYTINYLKLENEFDFTFSTMKTENDRKIKKSVTNGSTAHLPKMGKSNYPKWVNGVTQNEQMQLPKMGKCLKENNKKINNYNIYTSPTRRTNYSDDLPLGVGGNINFTNISLDCFCENDVPLVKSIVSLMKDVVTSNKDYTINNKKVTGKELYKKFIGYGTDEINYVIDVMRDTENIKYPRAFMLNVLYNADCLMDVYYDNKVKQSSSFNFYSDDEVVKSLELLGVSE